MKRIDKQPMLDDFSGSPDHSTVVPNPSISIPAAPNTSNHSQGFGQLPLPPEFSHLTTKVKLPPFSSADPRGWLTKAETYFQIHGIPDNYRIPLAHVSMEGVAVHWFSMVQEQNHNLSWESFKVELLN